MEKKQNLRLPWGDFPAAVANDVMGSLRFDAKDSEASEYDGGKRRGNSGDAMTLVRRKLRPEKVAELKALLQRQQVDVSNLVILPVDALEATGKNKIPLALAKILAAELPGVTVDCEIKQADRVSRTGQGINHRLAFMPSFDGAVQAKNYLLVDDTLRVGGTLANLRGYLNSRGGTTVAIFIMQSDEQSMILQPSEKTVHKLRANHGRDEVEAFCEREFGFSSLCLTRGEAGNIAAAKSLVEMTERIAAATAEGRGGVRPLTPAELEELRRESRDFMAEVDARKETQ